VSARGVSRARLLYQGLDEFARERVMSKVTRANRTASESGRVSPELLEITPERAAVAQAELMSALGAITLAESPEEAQEILTRAAQLVPELWRVPEMVAAMRLGFNLGRHRTEQGSGATICIEPGCGKPIVRAGERGKLPLRCDSCEEKHRREMRARWARDARKKAKIIDALANIDAGLAAEAIASIKDDTGEATGEQWNGPEVATIAVKVLRGEK
jgi:hypothetical protein